MKVNKTTRKDPTLKLIHLKENTSSRHTSSHNRALRSNTSAVATGPFKVKIPLMEHKWNPWRLEEKNLEKRMLEQTKRKSTCLSTKKS